LKPFTLTICAGPPERDDVAQSNSVRLSGTAIGLKQVTGTIFRALARLEWSGDFPASHIAEIIVVVSLNEVSEQQKCSLNF
jgi:hypothetical protein